MNIITTAKFFAIGAHSAVGQVRKYTNEPYWHHPQAVAKMMLSTYQEEPLVAAAWLHDVVEDTHITRDVIQAIFGNEVATLVWWLTDPPRDGNRAIRVANAKARLAAAPANAQTIKYADLIDNTASITAHDPKFAKVYLAEKRALLEVMNKGDTQLWERAWNLCTQ